MNWALIWEHHKHHDNICYSNETSFSEHQQREAGLCFLFYSELTVVWPAEALVAPCPPELGPGGHHHHSPAAESREASGRAEHQVHVQH